MRAPAGPAVAEDAPEASADLLPAAVAATHARLLAAAEAGDWAALEAETSRAGPAFAFSFADPGGSAVAFWRAAEDSAAFFTDLAALLQTAPHAAETVFIWPRWAEVEWDALSPADLRAMRAFVGADLFEDMDDLHAYIGRRIGISLDGTWLYYIGGD